MAQNKRQKLELTWIGKGEEPKLEPRILIENPEYSYGDPNSENMLIHGDNLLALKALEQDYAGKVKCIYIDPPYNTGHAFEYYDDFMEHSIWLNLMKQRLTILHKLLANSGVFWIQLDVSEVHYAKIILDEIFGRENFVAQINYERSGIGGIGQGGTFINTGEYILMYSKGELKINQIQDTAPIELKVMKRYNKILTDEGDKELIEEFKSKSNDSPVRIYKHSNYIIDSFSFKNYTKNKEENDRKYASYYNFLFRSFLIQKENSFQQDIISRMDKNCLYSVEYIPSRGKNKDKPTTLHYINKELIGWLKDTAELVDNKVVKTKKLTNIWTHESIPKADLPNEGKVAFPRGKKPENLLKRLLSISTNKGDIVLDSFLGSGTTAAVAHKMGRKFIGIELGEHAKTHCYPRLKNVINGEQSGISKSVNWQGGGGFKFYTLAPSLLQKDKYGNWIIESKYNSSMLAAAMAKQEGFKYQPHESLYWKQGFSTEQDFIYTTTQFITVESLDRIYEEMKPGESLLICCKSFQKECKGKYSNITIKKIPQMLLGRCEFGKEDYSLNIVNMPVDEPDEDVMFDEETSIQEISEKENKNDKYGQQSLFD
jgi:adenine-specific DNA-methyltransferase